MRTSPLTERHVQTVERICTTATSADDMFDALTSELRRLVPHDGAALMGIDPVTMLATAPSRVEGLDPALCDLYWHLEFHEQDPINISELASGPGTVGLLRTLDHRPSRSRRYREFLEPQGFGDELRSVFQSDGSTWGTVGLYRDRGRRPFDDDEVDFLKRISPVVAKSLRGHVRAANAWLERPCSPGLVVFDASGQVVSANADAACWLEELWPRTHGPAGSGTLDILSGCCTEIPSALHALLARARAVANGRDRVPARLRLRDRNGQWLVLHASALVGRDRPDDGNVAVVIEPAKGAEVAPIIIEAFSLTPREREVLAAIARGGSTADIARELYLSPHTVRDHVKTVFDKVGVSSRGELIARLFGDHYSDRLHDTMVHGH